MLFLNLHFLSFSVSCFWWSSNAAHLGQTHLKGRSQMTLYIFPASNKTHEKTTHVIMWPTYSPRRWSYLVTQTLPESKRTFFTCAYCCRMLTPPRSQRNTTETVSILQFNGMEAEIHIRKPEQIKPKLCVWIDSTRINSTTHFAVCMNWIL